MIKGRPLAKVLAISAVLFMLSAPAVMAQDFCDGDLNHDGSVGVDDTLIFLEDLPRNPWDENPCPPDGPAPVPETGQKISYTTTGGDDGDYEHGVAWPNLRFTDNGDGTIIDNLTGLIWLKDANCFGQRTWSDALSDCNGLEDLEVGDDCGLTDGSSAGDWRLPNRFELESLLHLAYYDPPVPDTAGTGQWSEGDPFTTVQSYYYWSSSTYAYSSVYAWYVYMRSGHVGYYNKTFELYVWPVRGGR